MGKWRITMLLLSMGLFVFSVGAADYHPHVNYKAKQATLEVHKKLKLLNKPRVKTIKSEDGDTVDCVDIYKQPAFDHPALQNHKIQITPNFREASTPSPSSSPSPSASNHVQNDHNSSQQVLSQIWQRSGSCPDGTIPIRRIQRRDLLRATGLEHFGKKPANSYHSINDEKGSVIINGTRVELGPQVNRSAAILVTVGYSYIGAQGDINIWNPKVESPDEFTTAQIWLKNGPGNAFESVESGWVVNPKVYGDGSTRLFVYWTKDAYKSTGCFDLTCPGFVQTNKDIALGMALQPISSASGPQYQTTFSITKDFHTNNWWVRVGQNIPVGYFPGELFSYLTKGAASLVEWGGEQIRIIDYSQQLKYPEWVGTFTDEEYCYAAVNYAASLAEEPVLKNGQLHLLPENSKCHCYLYSQYNIIQEITSRILRLHSSVLKTTTNFRWHKRPNHKSSLKIRNHNWVPCVIPNKLPCRQSVNYNLLKPKFLDDLYRVIHNINSFDPCVQISFLSILLV
ncbi:hypothetical protein D8674_032563 [Pyrus ussuriensis x Pyrus communis]|uniref:Neprosin PEP catalytic domain-containing protein n=1 Tax=Pyrus ussuriensis x Pyrus communis TaxID=2448454 RepID=A0A5N5HJE8_9ROSA|nr:hypothetical protein D8674_032563 [Pyrus ussuriensis x Pyrus communis]